MNNEQSELQTVLENFSKTLGKANVSSYSGRGMNGRECLSITSNARTNDVLAALVRAVGLQELDCDSAEEAIRAHRVDSCGLYTVVYFPGFTFSSDEEEDEENE